jgi:hypothetical protein
MNKVAVIVLAVGIVQSGVSAAGDNSTNAPAKPSSFVPHPHTKSHVYGAPIHPAIVGHPKSPHGKQTQKKPSSSQNK